MNNTLIRHGAVIVGIALVAGALYMTRATASSVYNFTARGVVTAFDNAGKTVKVDVTKVDGKGKEDLEGNTTEFTVGSAKTMKMVNGKDKRVTYHNLEIGQEIAFKGTKNDDDTYSLTFIRINDRSFSMVGLLEGFSTSAKTIKISIISSTYKPAQYHKGIEVNMVYNDDTKFKSGSTYIVASDVNADAQKVKVTGVLKDSATWRVNLLQDKYKANK